MKDFLLYTFIGSSIWNIILALLGYFLYAQQDLMKEYYKDISIAAVILFLIFVLFLIYKFAMNRKKIAG